MRVFLVGDFESDNGPGIANRKIRDALVNNFEVSYSQATGKWRRIIEVFREIKKTDILVICSKSKLNYIAIKIARWEKKKILYIMHGYASYEVKIDNSGEKKSRLRNICKYESFVIDNVNKIVCVSKNFMGLMMEQFPDYKSKFDYIYNSVDVKRIRQQFLRSSSDVKNQILSVGGGMPRKNNICVAKAINNIYQVNEHLTYCVVGKEAVDGKEIKTYSFVRWFDHMSHMELIDQMNKSALYIQNSRFETFGLSIIEALAAGCSILISNNVGCKDLFTTIEESDIIYNVDDVQEIENKIKFLIDHGNNQRLWSGFQIDKVSKEWCSEKLGSIIYCLKG